MKRSLTVIAVVVAALAGGGFWYVQSKLPTRQGQVALATLQGPVTVRYDERGVPHIRAGNQADMYRALGYVQAQDRLFQMEIMRRLARGELAEVLGPKLVDTDKLFRSLRIRERAASYLAELDPQSPAFLASTLKRRSPACSAGGISTRSWSAASPASARACSPRSKTRDVTATATRWPRRSIPPNPSSACWARTPCSSAASNCSNAY